MKKIFIIIFAFLFLLSGCNNTIDDNSEEKTVQQEKMIGVWVNYNEIDSLIKTCETQEQLNKRIDSMLTEFKKFNINTVFLHSRAFDDCFYVSEIYMPSSYCSNSKGELKFDILNSFINCSKLYDIQIHAWVNPYRIRKDNNTDLINENSLAGKWYSKNPNDQRLIITENSIFYNPSSVEVQNYILKGIKEILDNYAVHGIHIDDYFYPTTDKSLDSLFYSEYTADGGTLSLADFRRQNVNALVSSIYMLVKSYDENLYFSVSPSADIEGNFNTHYADVTLWASQLGYVDYLIPQIYFGFENETMPFENLLSEWCQLKSDKVKIAVGIPIYKSGEVDVYAKSGSNEWIEYSDILKRQITLINNNSLDGYVYYSSSYLLNDYNENLKNEKNNILS